MAHAGGRPTEYSKDILDKVQAYLKLCEDEIEEYHKTRGDKSDSYDRIVRVKLPSIEGLAFYLKINKDTIYDWCKIHKEFSDVIDDLRSMQADRLINSGLSGDYNPTIAKVLLTKHGYIDKQETDITTKGEKIESNPLIVDLANKLNGIYKGTSIGGNGEATSPLDTQVQD